MHDLETVADALPLRKLSPTLARAVDKLLGDGLTPREIVIVCRSIAGSRTAAVRAVEEYLESRAVES